MGHTHIKSNGNDKRDRTAGTKGFMHWPAQPACPLACIAVVRRVASTPRTDDALDEGSAWYIVTINRLVLLSSHGWPAQLCV